MCGPVRDKVRHDLKEFDGVRGVDFGVVAQKGRAWLGHTWRKQGRRASRLILEFEVRVIFAKGMLLA